MSYVIEKGVALPKGKRSEKSTKYPFKSMEVGDSFLVPDFTSIVSLRSQASVTGRTLGKKFSVRLVEQGVRIWRVE